MSEIMLRTAEVRPGSLDEAKRTVDVVWSTGARVARYGGPISGRWTEELDLAGARLDLLNSGAKLLDSHKSDTVGAILGRVERAWVEGQTGYATVRFSDRPAVEGIWQDVRSGILDSLSVGYRIRKIEPTPGAGENGTVLGRVVDWQPFELSFVAHPADAAAKVRSDEGLEVLDAGAASESTGPSVAFLKARNTHRSRRQA